MSGECPDASMLRCIGGGVQGLVLEVPGGSSVDFVYFLK